MSLENLTKEVVRQRVLDIISDIAPDEDLSQVKPDVALREQLSLDSMDFLDIVMELRKKYNVEVPENDYGNLRTLDSCTDYLFPKMSK